jgi:hypothetical protein
LQVKVKLLLSKPKKQEEASHVMNVSLPLQTTAPSTCSQCVQCVQSSPDPSSAPHDSSAATINPPAHGIHEALGHRHRERASRSPRLVKGHRHSSPSFRRGGWWSGRTPLRAQTTGSAAPLRRSHCRILACGPHVRRRASQQDRLYGDVIANGRRLRQDDR